MKKINRAKIKAMWEEAGKRLNWININTKSVLSARKENYEKEKDVEEAPKN